MADKPLFSMDLGVFDRFDSFKSEFDAYASTLKSTVDDWKAVSKAINDSRGQVRGLNEAVRALKVANDNSRANNNRPGVNNNNNRPPQPPKPDPALQMAMRGMNEKLTIVASEMKKVSSTLIRQVGSYAGGATSGVIGGVEGLLSGLSKSGIVQAVVTMAAAAVTAPMLAAFAAAPDVANLRKQALGLGGLNTGTIRAARAAGSWMADPMKGLESAQTARRDQFSPEFQAYSRLFGGGRNAQAELGRGPGVAQFDALDKIVEKLSQFPEAMQDTMADAIGGTKLFSLNTIRQYQAMDPDARRQRRQEFLDTERATRDPDNGKVFTDFYAKMNNLGEMIEAGFVKKLEPLLGPMSDWVSKLTSAINEDDGFIANWIAELAKIMKEYPPDVLFGKFQEGLKGMPSLAEIGADLKLFGEGIHALVNSTAFKVLTGQQSVGDATGVANMHAGPMTEKDIKRNKDLGFDRYGAKFNADGSSANFNADGTKKEGAVDRAKKWLKGNWGVKDQPGVGPQSSADTFAPYKTAGLDWQAPPGLKHLGTSVGGALSENPAASAVGATGNAMLLMRFLPMLRAFMGPVGAAGAAAAVMKPTPAESGELPRKYWPEAAIEEEKKQTELLSGIKDHMDKAEAFGAGGGAGGAGGAGGGSGAFLAGRYGKGGGGAPAGVRARSMTMGGGAAHPFSGKAGATRVAHGALAAHQQEAYDAALKEGMDPESAKAMVANLSGESLRNPADVHDDPSRRNPNQKAHGIASWDDARSARIAKQFGKMPQDMSVAEQVKALAWETKTFSPKTWAKLTDPNRSAAAKVGTWVSDVERPGDPGTAISQRLGHLAGLKVGGGAAVASGGGATSEDVAFFNARKGKGVSGNAEGLNADFAGRMRRAMTDAEKATGEKGQFASLTRDRAVQERLYYNYTHGIGGQGLAAKPGTSLHERGLATDLSPGKNRDWIRAHAGDYGLGLVPGDPEHVEMSRALRAHAGDTRLGQLKPAGHQTSPVAQNTSQPLGIHNWQMQPRPLIEMRNKTGSDMHLSAATMAS